MRTTIRWFLIVVLLAVVRSGLYSQSIDNEYFSLDHFRVTMVDSVSHLARITLSARIAVAGRLTTRLHLHGDGVSRQGRVVLRSGRAEVTENVRGGERIEREWTVLLPDDGYMELGGLYLLLDTAEKPGKSDGVSASYFLFAHMKHGRITASGNAPMEEFMRPPVEVAPPADIKEKGATVQSIITLTINISGRITCFDRSGVIEHGVPNVRVSFDWDADNDDGTIFNPIYSDGATNFTVTDADGYYTFIRQADVPDINWVWGVPNIRTVVRMSNDAAYNGTYGSGAYFGQQSHIPLSISPSSPDISVANNDIEVESVDGNALRFLWRAREFDINDLAGPGGIPKPSMISYYYTPSSDPDARDNFQGSGPKINFIDVPIAEVTYHEYGHYIQWLYGEHVDGGCPTHKFSDRHNDGCAIKEGWAEFHSAAAQAYWWMRENMIRREGDYLYDTYMTFLDNGPSNITANSGDEEGAIATFLYNLWDDKGTRAIGSSTPGVPYAGDNDDLDNNRPFGHPRPWLVYCLNNVSRYAFKFVVTPLVSQWFWLRQPPYFDAYRENYLAWVKQWYPLTSAYHQESINAMYADFTSSLDTFRAATPTVLTVTGNKSARSLHWNDHTGPSQYNFLSELETSGSGTVQLDDNDESGFAIWRKRVGVQLVSPRGHWV